MDYSPILKQLSIAQLNDMQEAAIKAVAENENTVLIAPTGSGKTLAFLLPVLAGLNPNATELQGLIIVPSRELALQIEKVFKQMGTPFKINSVYGGHSVRMEENNLGEAPALLVGTPGRISHHLRTHTLNFSSVHSLVLDEFDKSLEMGFKEEMAFIIGKLGKLKKRILTSATPLKEIPGFVRIDTVKQLDYSVKSEDLVPDITHRMVQVNSDDKTEALTLLLSKIGSKQVIVFCNHRDAVNRISDNLNTHKVSHGIYHGGLEQIDREKVLIKFRNGSLRFLLTTDLAARGLDIPDVEFVVHYQLPATKDTWIHRNGRTARMKAHGTVYYLLDIGEYLPDFVTGSIQEDSLPETLGVFEPIEWKTLYFSAGKKDKINKVDIVGLLHQKGKLGKEDLGKIEILDHSAYAAVKSGKMQQTLKLVQNEKIKGKKVKIEIAS